MDNKRNSKKATPARQPQEIDVFELFNALYTTGHAKLSDHVKK